MKRRIVEGTKMWGAVLEKGGNKYKADYQTLINLAEGTSRIVVDFPGADIPVYLTTMVVNGKKVLRTLWDATIKNNLSRVAKVKLVSCNKCKVLKK